MTLSNGYKPVKMLPNDKTVDDAAEIVWEKKLPLIIKESIFGVTEV